MGGKLWPIFLETEFGFFKALRRGNGGTHQGEFNRTPKISCLKYGLLRLFPPGIPNQVIWELPEHDLNNKGGAAWVSLESSHAVD